MKAHINRKLALPAALVLASLGIASAAGPATASTTSVSAGSFDTNSGASLVTGNVYFDSSTSFHLTDVKLTDRICGDGRFAEFRVKAFDLASREVDFPWHKLDRDCASPVIWTDLPGSISSGLIKYLQIQTNACTGGIFNTCSSSAYSRDFNDPYS